MSIIPDRRSALRALSATIPESIKSDDKIHPAAVNYVL